MKPVAYKTKGGFVTVNKDYGSVPLYAIPKGYKLVPIDPTEEIMAHCCDLGKNKNYFLDREEFREFWDLFIKVAPNIGDI